MRKSLARCRTLFVLGTVAVLAAACGRTARPPKTAAPPAAVSPVLGVVPIPAVAVPSPNAAFRVTQDTTIYVPSGDERAAWVGRYLSDLIGVAAPPAAPAVHGTPRPVLKKPAVKPAVDPLPTDSIVLQLTASGPAESYELTVTASRVTLSAPDPAGLFYAVQTLRQLMPSFVEYTAVRGEPTRPLTIAPGHIVDRPRFAWRGAMLDVARHFMHVDEVKRYIDLISLYKMNRLHLHLADDQGWRIEISSRPNLTAYGATSEVGGGSGGYYTKQQYADLVAYAQQRFVVIVPEIDMPGHTNAALASYPELNCDGVAPPLFTGTDVGFSVLCVNNEATYAFIDDVVRELAAMTPGAYFHVGGDEVKKLTPEEYVAFVERVQGIVQAHGKTMIGWDEIAAANLLPTTIVQHWRSEAPLGAVAARGARFVLSPGKKTYLDMKYDRSTAIGLTWAGLIDVKDAYGWDPATLLDGVPASAILGVEAPLWTETIADIREIEYLAFPRLAAIAEVGWSAAERRAWEDFRERLGSQGPRWSALGINFYHSPQIEWRR